MTFPLRRALFPLLAIAAASALTAPAQADDVRRVKVPSGFAMVDGVNVRNGNFSLTYSAFDNGTGVSYPRTFNSRSVNRGVFGLGWGSPFDTRVVPMPDGTAVVRENGNGAHTTYGRASAEAVTAGAAEIAETVRALRKGEPKPDLAKQLAEDRRLRADTVVRYGIKFDPPTGDLPIDRSTTYVGAADDCDEARLRFLDDNGGVRYTRKHCNGVVDTFNGDGNLTGLDVVGRPTMLKRKNGRIERIETGGGHVLTFAYAPQKLTVTDETGRANVYEFDARGRNTVLTSDVMGKVTFAYDERSNLTRVGYVDTTFMAITYDKHDQATSVRDRNGRITTFEYGDTADGYETIVRKPGADGAVHTVIYVMNK